jgi:hypothetical protein
LVSRVLSWLFVGLWPKKKAEVLKDNLAKLAKAFDTTEDPTLQLKGLSLKRGREGVMSTHTSILVDSVGPPSAEVCRAAASFP